MKYPERVEFMVSKEQKSKMKQLKWVNWSEKFRQFIEDTYEEFQDK